MLRVFYSDLRFLLNQLSLKICIGIVMGYTLMFVVVLKIITLFLNSGNFIYGEDVLSAYGDVAIFAITAATLLIFSSDFANGTIRNKLVNGIKRRHIFLSAVFNGMLAATFMTVIVTLFETLLALIFTDGFMTYTLPELSNNFLMLIITSASIGAFTTTLVMVFGGNRISYFIGFIIAFFLSLIGSEVTTKLYPMNGKCTLQGAKLVLYTAYDRFMPYMHFEGYPRWDIYSYLLGSIVLTVLSIAVGLVIFERKEIK